MIRVALCTLLVFQPALLSADCRKVIRKVQVVEKVVEKVVKVDAVAVPVAVAAVQVPYYAAYYNPPAPVPAVAEDGTANRLDRVERALERLLQQGTGGQVPVMPPADGGTRLRGSSPAQFASSCLGCHRPGGAGTKGNNGVVLFDPQGALVPGVEGRMLTAVYAGRMPKDSQMDDKAVAEFISGMDAHLSKK